MVSDKWSVSGAGKRLMIGLHLLNDFAEINKLLNASIKSLATIHWPLSTIHLATPLPHTTVRIIQSETGVFQIRGILIKGGLANVRSLA